MTTRDQISDRACSFGTVPALDEEGGAYPVPIEPRQQPVVPGPAEVVDTDADGRGHGAAMAASTSSLAARRAGRMAATIPASAATTMKITSETTGIRYAVMPSSASERDNAPPNKMPTTIPSVAPKRDTTTDSHRTMRRN